MPRIEEKGGMEGFAGVYANRPDLLQGDRDGFLTNACRRPACGRYFARLRFHQRRTRAASQAKRAGDRNYGTAYVN